MAGASGRRSVVWASAAPAAAKGEALAGNAVNGAPRTGRVAASAPVAAARWTTPSTDPARAGPAASPLTNGLVLSAGSSVAATGGDESAPGLGGSAPRSFALPGPGTAATGRTGNNFGRRATVSGPLTERGRTE
ncbi:hypothetical protein ACIG5E_36105 [Kitasatospora sp. NPDC053057]|uniref:hypothetical protein n=1 Tax=Kitasatospora sp. NPDC053057 TaxID=3364062 RepID=UPI0037C9175F